MTRLKCRKTRYLSWHVISHRDSVRPSVRPSVRVEQ